MDARAALIVLIVATAAAAQQHDHNHENHWVNVSIYYESLCPDSIKFFTQQLYPSLQGNLSKFVNLTLVPFGKSTFVYDVNQYEFTCHHGPTECDGNKLHLCSIKMIENGKKSEDLSYNKVAIGFINCLMDKVKREGNTTKILALECANINPVRNLNDIQNCAAGVEGAMLLHQAGEATMALQPPLKSVPTIVFNNQFKGADNDMAQTNFVKALCQYIQGEKPAECSRNSATLTRATSAVVTAVAVALFALAH